MEAGHCLEDLLRAVEEEVPIKHNTRPLINKVLEEKILKQRKADR
jgi:hypothetical protein